MSTEGQVTIEADKAEVRARRNSQLLLKTPFAGRMLVTVERDHVFDHFYVDTDQKSARVSVPIPRRARAQRVRDGHRHPAHY
ncbi:MAG: hypothetical protein WKG07_10115 [Hymenobacter sp.]